MPALRKPHRIGVLLPDVTIEGDVAVEPEAAILLWVALIECCQRHPMLAVYDPESTPLFPHEGHFAPQHASIGATPTDAFYGSTRRDELVWLEVKVQKSGGGVVRLHTLARDGSKQSFDALGKNFGDQVQQVLASWLSARGLGALPRKFESVSAEELIQVVRIIAPLLVDEARAWATPVKIAPSEADLDAVFGDPDPTESGVSEPDPLADEPEESDDDDELAEEDEAVAPAPVSEPAVRRKKVARPIANRLPAPLRLAALRLLHLAIREELDDLILLADPEQPQALFAQYLASAGQGRDFALLRRVIAAAPCWARPYAELVRDEDDDGDEEGDAAIKPTDRKSVV